MSKVPFNMAYLHDQATVGTGVDMLQVRKQKKEDKRFGTAQICVHPGTAVQPRISLIFHGQGSVTNAEKSGYHPDVDVYFQKAAWADEKFCRSWASTTLKKWVGDAQPKEFVLFSFQEKIAVPPNCSTS